MSATADPRVTDALRERLRTFADVLIPAAHGMPAASEVGVADGQLDCVVAARPDLVEPLARAVEVADPGDHERVLAWLADEDSAAYDALLLTVVGGYYIDPDVRRRLGYTGQVPVEMRPEIIPNYVEEGLIEPLLARGPIYRQVPDDRGPTDRPSPSDEPRTDGKVEMTTEDHTAGGR